MKFTTEARRHGENQIRIRKSVLMRVNPGQKYGQISVAPRESAAETFFAILRIFA
jgi:hypothetical protein